MRMTIVALVLWNLIVGCGQKKGSVQGLQNDPKKNTELSARDQIRLKQYRIQGRILYKQHCSNCHQADGSGLAELYPPLKESDFFVNNLERSICGIRYGMEGEIIVKGKVYNHPMPANLVLSELEIAEIATYIYSEWNGKDTIINQQAVRTLLRKCE